MTQSLAPLFLMLATFFWGSNFNAAQYVVEYMPPLSSAAERFVLASLILVVYMALKNGIRFDVLKRNLIAFICLGTLGVAGFNIALFIGITTTTPLNGALIMATTPLSTAFFSSIMERTSLSSTQKAGLVISFIGVLIVISNGDVSALLALNFVPGDLFILSGSLAWAIYSVSCRKYTAGATPIEITTYTMVFGSLVMLIAAIASEDVVSSVQSATWQAHLSLIYMAIFGSVLAYLFWNSGLQLIGAAKTGAFFSLVPVFTMLLAIINGNIPNLYELVGAAIVIFGTLFASQVFTMKSFKSKSA